jgi:hypothetical protein
MFGNFGIMNLHAFIGLGPSCLHRSRYTLIFLINHLFFPLVHDDPKLISLGFNLVPMFIISKL